MIFGRIKKLNLNSYRAIEELLKILKWKKQNLCKLIKVF